MNSEHHVDDEPPTWEVPVVGSEMPAKPSRSRSGNLAIILIAAGAALAVAAIAAMVVGKGAGHGKERKLAEQSTVQTGDLVGTGWSQLITAVNVEGDKNFPDTASLNRREACLGKLDPVLRKSVAEGISQFINGTTKAVAAQADVLKSDADAVVAMDVIATEAFERCLPQIVGPQQLQAGFATGKTLKQLGVNVHEVPQVGDRILGYRLVEGLTGLKNQPSQVVYDFAFVRKGKTVMQVVFNGPANAFTLDEENAVLTHLVNRLAAE